MIFENFWEAFQVTSFFGFSGVFPDTEEIVAYIPLCLFPIFSLLPQTRISPTWDSAFIVKILPIPHLMHFRSNPINLSSLSLLLETQLL